MRATAFMSARALELLDFAQEAHKADAYVMAVQAAERAKEYVAALDSEDRDPALVRKLRETWRALGRSPPALDKLDPHERVAAVLDRQVAQAKAEAGELLPELVGHLAHALQRALREEVPLGEAARRHGEGGRRGRHRPRLRCSRGRARLGRRAWASTSRDVRY